LILTSGFICRIESGAYYEAHQQLRVIAARYIKQSNYEAAAEILAGGATALLRAGSQQGASASGGDLAIMLVLEVYTKAGWGITGGDDDAEGRARKSESDLSIEHRTLFLYGGKSLGESTRNQRLAAVLKILDFLRLIG
jgi:hypothetical protein